MCFRGVTSPLILMWLGSIVNTLGSLCYSRYSSAEGAQSTALRYLYWIPTYTCALPKMFPVSCAEQMRSGISFLLLFRTLQLQGFRHQLLLLPLMDSHDGGTPEACFWPLDLWPLFPHVPSKTNHTCAPNKSSRKC